MLNLQFCWYSYWHLKTFFFASITLYTNHLQPYFKFKFWQDNFRADHFLSSPISNCYVHPIHTFYSSLWTLTTLTTWPCCWSITHQSYPRLDWMNLFLSTIRLCSCRCRGWSSNLCKQSISRKRWAWILYSSLPSQCNAAWHLSTFGLHRNFCITVWNFLRQRLLSQFPPKWF